MLSERIKALRNQKGLSQEAFASRLSVVRQTVSKWEKGLSVPDSDMLVLIAKELDTTVAELISEESNKSTTKRQARKKANALSIILIILGFPVWFSIAVSLFAVALSIYLSLWAVIISLWATFVSVIAFSLFCMIAGFSFTVKGIALLGASIALAGLAILSFFGCKAATNGIILLTKKIFIIIKNCFSTKGAVQ